MTPRLLIQWQTLLAGETSPVEQTQLLHSITTHEQEAIVALARVTDRLRAHKPFISTGYNETNAKQDGIIRHEVGDRENWDEVILQGSHFSAATPFAKQPNLPMRNGKDWIQWDLASLSEDEIPRSTYARACDRNIFEAAQDRWDDSPSTKTYRLAWRRMIDPKNTERSLFATLIPPGPPHVHTVNSMAFTNDKDTALNAGFWASLPLDYLLRVTGRSDLQQGEALKMPAATSGHPLTHPLLLRTLRLNALTNAYAPLWEALFDKTWPAYEDWANPNWPKISPLATHLRPNWMHDTPLRTEYARRAALVEIDALVSVWLGITAGQLVAIYKSRYAVLSDRESAMYFDAAGRRIASDPYAYGHGQGKDTYLALLSHLETPEITPPPVGYTAPFYKADREAEMRAAHAHFQDRLDKEIAAGRWVPPGSREA